MILTSMTVPEDRMHSRSDEEEDILIISSKKVRAAETPREKTVSEIEITSKEPKTILFKDRLLGFSDGNYLNGLEKRVSDETI